MEDQEAEKIGDLFEENNPYLTEEFLLGDPELIELNLDEGLITNIDRSTTGRNIDGNNNSNKSGPYVWNPDKKRFEIQNDSSEAQVVRPRIRLLPLPLISQIRRPYRIDAVSMRMNDRPGSYHDRFLLERVWKHLGGAKLFQEIRIPQSLLDRPCYGPLISYQFESGAFMTPIHYPGSGNNNQGILGILGGWYGIGNTEDFLKPIEAIEIFRLPGWDRHEYSYCLFFSNETFLITTEHQNAEKKEDIKPCGIEFLSSEGVRIQL